MDKPADKLADVALEKQTLYAPIDQVGMGNIEVPILLGSFRVPALVDAKVSLDRASSRGIHMSRLYLSVQETLSRRDLNYALLKELTADFLKSHADLSRHSYVAVKFSAPLERQALKSDFKAWRNYPVTLSAENHEGAVKLFAEVMVTYSSTCPASAALSRQLIQANFSQEFVGQADLSFKDIHQWLGTSQGINATPHAQRSEALVKVQVASAETGFSFEKLIDLVEEALQTPVQGAVKREDEQEFALRNGQNLMFCEDASRRLKTALDQVSDVVDYRISVKHLESLHPHNAEATLTKNISGGLR